MHKEYKTNDITIIWKPELCQHVGESTRSEIEYAKKNGKAIEYLEPVTDKP